MSEHLVLSLLRCSWLVDGVAILLVVGREGEVIAATTAGRVVCDTGGGLLVSKISLLGFLKQVSVLELGYLVDTDLVSLLGV